MGIADKLSLSGQQHDIEMALAGWDDIALMRIKRKDGLPTIIRLGAHILIVSVDRKSLLPWQKETDATGTWIVEFVHADGETVTARKVKV